MTSLDQVSGLSPDQAAWLGALGILSAEELATADSGVLKLQIDALIRKRGISAAHPNIFKVDGWIEAARKLAPAPVTVSIDDIPEAIPFADVPEALTDPSVAAPTEPAPKPQRVTEPKPAPKPDRAPEEAPQLVGGLDKMRLQTLEAYANSERGIQPLSREISPITHSEDKLYLNAKGGISRRTRRGVLYPNPGRAAVGALVSLIWRVAALATIIGLPMYLYLPGRQANSTATVLGWLGGLSVVGFFQLVAMEKVRCRVCSCHLFLSKRCIKNSKAHLLRPLGYVASLALHMLTFQWFRCMYCGTAIRLFGGRVKHVAMPIENSDDEED